MWYNKPYSLILYVFYEMERENALDKRRIIYYRDELNEEFSTARITARTIDGNYQYDHTSAWKKITHFFWYRIIATPIAFFYTKIVFRHKVVGRKKFKAVRDQGYFLYGNHTQDIGDAFMPHLMNFPKNNSTIVHPNNVSMPYLGRITPSLGAIPLPDDRVAYRNFLHCVDYRIQRKDCIVIYPEAHIWPFYTKIRPFSDTSFHYPVKLDAPVFCFTNTYQKRKCSQKPRIVTYIDGPFYPNKELPIKEQKKDLRDRVYACMVERAKASEVEWIRYVKQEE